MKPVFLIAIVAVAMIGVMVPSVYATGSQTFENQELGISFSVPEGWLLQQPDKTTPGSPDVAVVGPKIDGVNPVISLTITDEGDKTIDDLITEKNDVLAEAVNLNKLEILSQEKIKSNVYQTEAIANFEVDDKTVQIKFLEIIILSEQKSYTFAYINIVDNFDNEFLKFKESLDSFKTASQGDIVKTTIETSTEEGTVDINNLLPGLNQLSTNWSSEVYNFEEEFDSSNVVNYKSRKYVDSWDRFSNDVNVLILELSSSNSASNLYQHFVNSNLKLQDNPKIEDLRVNTELIQSEKCHEIFYWERYDWHTSVVCLKDNFVFKVDAPESMDGQDNAKLITFLIFEKFPNSKPGLYVSERNDFSIEFPTSWWEVTFDRLGKTEFNGSTLSVLFLEGDSPRDNVLSWTSDSEFLEKERKSALTFYDVIYFSDNTGKIIIDGKDALQTSFVRESSSYSRNCITIDTVIKESKGHWKIAANHCIGAANSDKFLVAFENIIKSFKSFKQTEEKSKIAQLEAEQQTEQEARIAQLEAQLEAKEQEARIAQLEAQLEAEQNGGGCLIATATYGSEMASEVQQLRELRDNQLLNTESGTQFMGAFNDIYYSFSPVIADYERENPYFKEAVKLAITPMISSLSLMENAESESEVLSIGISVILLNLGMYLGVPAVVIVGIKKIK